MVVLDGMVHQIQLEIMTMQTRNCEECKHSQSYLPEEMRCLKGHKPRFYTPKDISDAMRGNWGWKGKCEDFEEKNR